MALLDACKDEKKQMIDLIVPNKLNAGDTVAFISISGGRAGDADMLPRYQTGKTGYGDS